MSVPPGTDAELLQVFRAECGEVLDEGDRILDFLARRPRSVAGWRSLLRHYHTLRGAAATVGRADVAAHLERGESLLQALDGTAPTDPGTVGEALRRYHASLKGLIEAGEAEVHRWNPSAELRAAIGAGVGAAAAATAGVDPGPLPCPEGHLEPKHEAGSGRVLPATEVEALLRRVAQVAAAGGGLAAKARELGGAAHPLAAEMRQLARATTRLRHQILRTAGWGAALPSLGSEAEVSVEEAVRLEAGHRGFIVPMASVERAVALEPAQREPLRRERVLSFRGHRLPLLFLAPLAGSGASEETLAVVLRAGRRLMAVAVDRALAREEVVVHRLFGLFAAHPFVSGVALAAEGDVLFRLEVERLFALCAHEELLPPEAAPEADEVPRGRDVLVVDDSRLARQLASRFLGADYDVETAVDGLDALEKLAASRFRVVVTDLEMPGLHGYDLLHAIRRDPRWSHLPVIVCTSCAGEAYRTRAFELGADGYLTKPFSRDQLRGEVQRALAQRAGDLTTRAAMADSE